MFYPVAIAAFSLSLVLFLMGQFAACSYWLVVGCGTLLPVRFAARIDSDARFVVPLLIGSVMLILFTESSDLQMLNSIFGIGVCLVLAFMFGRSLYDYDQDFGFLWGGWWPTVVLATFISLTQLLAKRGSPFPGFDQLLTGISFVPGSFNFFESGDATEDAGLTRLLVAFTSMDQSEDVASIRIAICRHLWLLLMALPLGSLLQLLSVTAYDILRPNELEAEEGTRLSSWNWLGLPLLVFGFIIAPQSTVLLLLLMIGLSTELREYVLKQRWRCVLVAGIVLWGCFAAFSGEWPPITRMVRPGLFALGSGNNIAYRALPLDQRVLFVLSLLADVGPRDALVRGGMWLLAFAVAAPLGVGIRIFSVWFWRGVMKYESTLEHAVDRWNAADPTVSESLAETNNEVEVRQQVELPATIDSTEGSKPSTSFAEIDFGQYEILDVIGRGGMGRVYKARHKRLGRVVALKTILTGASSHGGAMRRFQEEAESAAGLDHPTIVPVYEFGSAKGELYFTMAYIEGQSLAQRLATGPIEARQAAYFVQQAAIAAAFAHERGVVHRDLKPGNILLDRDGSVKVTDFGLARRLDVLEADSEAPLDFPFLNTYETVCRLTQTGAVMGTPAYMAPEQALDAKRAGPPADVWALGAVLFVCLTGRPPFHSENAMETLTLLIEADPPTPRSLNPAVDFDLEAICIRCLQKKEADRYASATELAADLDRWLQGHTPRAARLTWLEQLRRFDVAYPEVLALATGGVAFLLGNLQEAIFVTIVIAMMRTVSPGPNWPQILASGMIWGVISIVGPIVSMFKHATWDVPTDELLINFNEPAVNICTLLSALVGAPVGMLFAFGGEAVAGKSESLRWYWRGTLLLAIAGFIVVYVMTTTARHSSNFDKTNMFWTWFNRDGGFVPALLIVVPLAISVGALLQRMQARITRLRGASGKWARLFVPTAVACAGCSTLLVAALIPFSETRIALDLTGYCGPGPLLTHAEQVFRDFTGLPVLPTWTIIFFSKFFLLSLPMLLVTAIVSWLLRERVAK
ncbi:serine/threonine-protein kinase [Anatilimnocola floriformis]|uniref:serine/threonine-protein kinase n=1 Tax=Anatilimnocola floriformis TaxID=2948575 RepID=UPI0020C37400|nr:serine/threonine-protein kinase [Anatilimnocola floriformis]